MDLVTAPFDPQTATPDEWRRFLAYARIRDLEVGPDDPVETDESRAAWLRHPDSQWEEFRTAVLDPERPEVQIGEMDFEVSRPGAPSYETNRHIAWVWVYVLQAHRRRGLASRLLPKVVEIARERGCTVLAAGFDEEAGRAFATGLGARVTTHRRENRLDFGRVDWGMVEAWAAEGPRRSPRTRLRWFVGGIDDDLIEAYSRTFTEVFNQQPFGKAEHGVYVFTPQTIRERAGRYAASDMTWTVAATVEPDGTVSGLTETGVERGRPTFLFQLLTGVQAGHRGRGLGKWLKAEMLLRVRREFPQVRVVVTGNASSNAAMLSINERLGFRTHKEPVNVEMKAEDLARYIRDHGLSE